MRLLNTRLKICMLLACFFLCSISLVAQFQQHIDSIRAVQSDLNDTLLIQSYLDLGEIYEPEYPDSGLHYYNYALVQIEKELEGNSDNHSSLQKLKARALRYIGNVYNDQGIYDNAIDFYIQSLDIHKQINDQKGVAYCLNNIGNVHADQGNFEKAKAYYLQSVPLFEADNEKTGLAASFNNLGSIYFEEGEFQKSIDFFLKTLEIVKELDHKKGMANTYNNLGEAYHKQGQNEKSLEYYMNTLEVTQELGDKFGLCMVHANIADLYHTFAIEIQENKRTGSFDSQIKNSLHHGEQSLKIAREMNAPRLIAYSSEILQKVHTSTGNYSKALEFAELYIQTNQVLFSEEKTKALAEMQEKYQSLEKEKTIEKLEFENEIADNEIKRRKNQILFSFLGLILITISLLLVYSRYRLKHSLNKALELKNNELAVLNATKDKFVSILAHDLKNPFSAFANITSSLNRKFDQIEKTDQKYYIEELDRSALHLNKLLKNMLDWASAQMKPKFQTLDNIELNKLVSNMSESLEGFAKTRDITFINHVPPNIVVKANEGALNTILNNLITNAVKFSPIGNRVEIDAKTNKNKVNITVTDFGVGIAPEDIGKLFRIDVDSRSIGTPEGKGTGLGLILCKELAEKMNGQLSVESTLGKGTTIHLMLES
jgi:signal transduction histidine kinase/Tfp pilus assembly protein PilF